MEEKAAGKAKKKDELTKGRAIAAVIICFLVGALCIVIALDCYSPVKWKDAKVIQATFSYYEMKYDVRDKYYSETIILKFSDYEDMSIDNFGNVKSAVGRLRGGDSLVIRVHPRGGDILEIERGGSDIVSYRDATAHLVKEGLGIAAMGIFFSGFGIYYAGRLIKIIRNEKAKKSGENRINIDNAW